MKIRRIYLFFSSLIFLSIFSHAIFAQSLGNVGNVSESSKTSEYRVAFDDSGVGGLIFALDVLQELEPQLEKLESKYKVRFIFQHVGDSKNAPYGIKTPAQIAELTKALVEYTADLPQTKTLVIACNTASTVCNKEMDLYFKEKYPWLDIISMIEKSSKEIIDLASTISANKKDINIAFFATPATVKSGTYQAQIGNIATEKGQELKLFTYSPATWVNNIEKGIDKSKAEFEVQSDLEKFKINAGDNFQKITVLGLFCTHYPFYRKEIENFFQANGNKTVKILTQGHIFSDDIFSEILKNIKSDSINYPRRLEDLNEDNVFKIQIVSNITGENSTEMKSIVSKTHPQYSDRVIFSTVEFRKSEMNEKTNTIR